MCALRAYFAAAYIITAHRFGPNIRNEDSADSLPLPATASPYRLQPLPTGYSLSLPATASNAFASNAESVTASGPVPPAVKARHHHDIVAGAGGGARSLASLL